MSLAFMGQCMSVTLYVINVTISALNFELFMTKLTCNFLNFFLINIILSNDIIVL